MTSPFTTSDDALFATEFEILVKADHIAMSRPRFNSLS